MNSVVLEKLIVAQLAKKLPIFYGTQRFITVFTIAYHSLQSHTNPGQVVNLEGDALQIQEL
jgi:hypothetical protein